MAANLPTPGGSVDAWGQLLNGAVRDVEAQLTHYIYESAGSYPTRATKTSDPNVRVVWCGAATPPIGGAHAQPRDMWERWT